MQSFRSWIERLGPSFHLRLACQENDGHGLKGGEVTNNVCCKQRPRLAVRRVKAEILRKGLERCFRYCPILEPAREHPTFGS
jgi:hypothetical protein